MHREPSPRYVLRLEWFAYVVDLLVTVAFAHLAWRAWHRADRDAA